MCFNVRHKETCSNRRSIKRIELEARVLTAMRQQLLAPGRLQAFTAGYTEVMNQWRREQRAGLGAADGNSPRSSSASGRLSRPLRTGSDRRR